ncbi:hypothetical protein [Streptomyces qinglanensis]|uniref:Uncharacterized protein n=1 Tax=Streptomyces qinglanensis TaxID=943816 RepID=A0A1H9NTT4_9ACTN|nr:hypothetical protein [Streptomyces qinglanensis]SER39380.1 hypothetical protein SAMN05421870_101663 [Streptomyces qinglanensis]
MTAGYCAWHDGPADDVALIVVHEQGSGAGGGAYACLPCARPLARQRTTSAAAVKAIAAMETRQEQLEAARAAQEARRA